MQESRKKVRLILKWIQKKYCGNGVVWINLPVIGVVYCKMFCRSSHKADNLWCN